MLKCISDLKSFTLHGLGRPEKAQNGEKKG